MMSPMVSPIYNFTAATLKEVTAQIFTLQHDL
jgi:hypothetical protein